MNMTYVLWTPTQPRRSRVYGPLRSDHEGFTAPCVLCLRPLGGTGAQALPLQAIAIGPAPGDRDGAHKHNHQLPYLAAAQVVHLECARLQTDGDLDKLAGELVMTPRNNILPDQRPLAS